jgi:hypothetical protein
VRSTRIDEYDKPMLDVMDTGLKVSDGCNEMMLEDKQPQHSQGFLFNL